MTLELSTLKTLQVGIEPAGSFGVTLGSGLQYLPITEDFALPDPMRDLLDPMTAQASIDGYALKVLGKRSASIKVDMTLGSHGVDLVGNVAPPGVATWPLAAMLRTVLGGMTSPVTHTVPVLVQALSTSSAVILTAGAGVRYSRGMVCGFPVAGAIEMMEILSVSTDTLTLRQALTAAPTTGLAVRTAVTFFPSITDDGSALQFVAQGVELDDHFLIVGCQGSVSIEPKPGMLAKISFDLKGRSCVPLSAHSGIVSPTHAFYSPVAAMGGCVTVPTFGVTTRVEPLVTDCATTLGIAYGQITGYCAAETLVRHRRTRARTKATITLPYEDPTFVTARDARTLRGVYHQIGNQPGNAVLISQSRTQVVGIKRAQASGALAGQTIEFEALEDTLGTADFDRAPFRISFA